MKGWRAALLLAALILSCRTIESQLGVPGGQTLCAALTTDDGAKLVLWRWSPTELSARKVLVLPELGFDHRLVANLCKRLRDLGFDVATLDGRDVTGGGGRFQGLEGWMIDVALAAHAHGPKPYLVAIGLAGSVAWLLGPMKAVSGIVAIDVPYRHRFDNKAIRTAMSTLSYDPRLWMSTRLGVLLLGAGHDTPEDDVLALARLARDVPERTQADVQSLMHEARASGVPGVPMDVLISAKDNLVPSEDVLPIDLGRTPARRLGRMEGFARDYGHLDWLVDDAALDEIVPVIADDLERMP